MRHDDNENKNRQKLWRLSKSEATQLETGYWNLTKQMDEYQARKRAERRKICNQFQARANTEL